MTALYNDKFRNNNTTFPLHLYEYIYINRISLSATIQYVTKNSTSVISMTGNFN